MSLLRANQLPFRWSLRALSSKQLVYSEHGDPAKILQLQTVEISDKPKDREVLVKWRAAPINPADLNQLQGTYPVKPDLPAVGGNEGCGRVEKIGSGVEHVKVGDLVIPSQSGLGTWRTYGIHREDEVFAIDNDLDRNTAAMLQVNPSTAYRMLHDFSDLATGDIVVQNGANSAVGRYVIQIAHLLNFNLINVVRDRPNIEELKEELISGLGASVVYTEEEFVQASRVLSNVRLALNCVGGRSSFMLAKTLATNGCMVTYGGMSKKPVECPTGPLIFKNITLHGFWMSDWYTRATNLEKRNEMYAHLAEWFKTGQLKTTPVEERSLDDHQHVIGKSANMSGVKQLFVLE